VHAYGLAKRLKLKQVICPLGAGVTSALGFLVAAPAFSSTRSYVARLDGIDWEHLNRLYAEMEREAQALLVAAGGVADTIALRRQADLRYVGQGFEVTTPIPGGALGPEHLAEIRASFLDTYQALFGRHISELPIESMSWRLEASGPVPNVALNFGGQPTAHENPRKGQRQVYFPETGFAPCTVYNRYALQAGMELPGPAVIEERESTTVVGPDALVTVDRYLNLIIEISP
jgi:N-methylhydantoinase A